MDEQRAKLIEIRDKCLQNAEALLSVAERELNMGADHICFHLALLALEEIGKALLITTSTTIAVAGQDKTSLSTAFDDHEKKIFWALWGNFLRRDHYTKEEIVKNQELASGLHKHRLHYLYVDPNNPLSPDEKMRDGEARTLVELVRSRLELEKLTEIRQFEPQDLENLNWFYKSLEDSEKREHIFSKPSLDKLTELSDSRKWIKWIREIFDKHETEMQRLTERELARAQPNEKESSQPKYKVRIRVQSPSHSIRDNAFNKWNENVHNIKLTKTGKKELPDAVKSELIVDITLPKSVSIGALWEAGFYMAKMVVSAFNIGTRGIFWWNVSKDIEKYYDEISDLEEDPKGSIKIKITAGKRLAINWEEAHFALSHDTMLPINMALVYIMREPAKLKKYLEAYAIALTMLSKTDIHLRLEANAFEQFWISFKEALRAHGDWDGKSDIKAAIKKQFEAIPAELKDLDKTIDLALALEEDDKRQKIHPITLTEVVAMKGYGDTYLHLKIAEHFKNNDPTKEDPSNQNDPPSNEMAEASNPKSAN